MLQESEFACLGRINELMQDMCSGPDILIQAVNSLYEISQMLGFNSFTYVGGRLLAGHKITGWQAGTRPVTITNIEDEFRRLYSQQRLDTYDPVLKFCFHTIYPQTWSKICSWKAIDHREKRFMELSCDFDMKDGMSFPIHGPGSDYGILSFSAANQATIPNTSLVAMVNLFSQRLHAVIRESFEQCTQNDSAKLASREIDILYWCAEGKTAWEIGQILGISDRTVETHIRNAKQKLNAVTTVQAVAKAMTLRFNEPI